MIFIGQSKRVKALVIEWVGSLERFYLWWFI